MDTASTSQRPVNALEVIDLEVGGMTCASCAARIEKKLNKLDGVEASVNYATEKANVRVPEGVSADDLIAVVEKTGYTAKLPAPRTHLHRLSAGEGRGARRPLQAPPPMARTPRTPRPLRRPAPTAPRSTPRTRSCAACATA